MDASNDFDINTIWFGDEEAVNARECLWSAVFAASANDGGESSKADSESLDAGVTAPLLAGSFEPLLHDSITSSAPMLSGASVSRMFELAARRCGNGSHVPKSYLRTFLFAVYVALVVERLFASGVTATIHAELRATLLAIGGITSTALPPPEGSAADVVELINWAIQSFCLLPSSSRAPSRSKARPVSTLLKVTAPARSPGPLMRSMRRVLAPQRSVLRESRLQSTVAAQSQPPPDTATPPAAYTFASPYGTVLPTVRSGGIALSPPSAPGFQLPAGRNRQQPVVIDNAARSQDPLAAAGLQIPSARLLTSLDMSGRRIAVLHENFRHLAQLQALWLDDNKICVLEGLLPPADARTISFRTRLTSLSVARNRLIALGPDIPRLSQLETLDLSNNSIVDARATCTVLARLRHLRNLVLLGNPLAQELNYRALAVAFLPQLEVLDFVPITAAERQSATSMLPHQQKRQPFSLPAAFGRHIPPFEPLEPVPEMSESVVRLRKRVSKLKALEAEREAKAVRVFCSDLLASLLALYVVPLLAFCSEHLRFTMRRDPRSSSWRRSETMIDDICVSRCGEIRGVPRGAAQRR